MINQEMSMTRDKERKLLDKIQHTKQQLIRLKDKRKKELGALAMKHNLDVYSNSVLNTAFASLAKELADGAE